MGINDGTGSSSNTTNMTRNDVLFYQSHMDRSKSKMKQQPFNPCETGCSDDSTNRSEKMYTNLLVSPTHKSGSISSSERIRNLKNNAKCSSCI